MRWRLALALCSGCWSDPPPPDCLPARLIEPTSSDTDESTPWLSEDRLELVFASDRGAKRDLYRSTRASIEEDFGRPVRFEGDVNTAADDMDPFFSDEQTLWFTSDRAKTGTFELHRATRSDRTSITFGQVERFEALGELRRPTLTTDGLSLYFAANSSGFATVHYSTRKTAESTEFTAPVPVPVMQNDYAFSPWISGDGDQLLYVTQVDGRSQIVRAEREVDGFGEYEIAPGTGELPWPSADTDPALHPGGRTMIFARATSSAAGRDLHITCE